MANDGSLASRYEEWIQSTIAAITPEFDSGDVYIYGGVPSFDSVMKILLDIKTGRNPTAYIMADSMTRIDLGADLQSDRGVNVDVYIGVTRTSGDVSLGIAKGATARIGEDSTTFFGTHALVEACWMNLHAKHPALTNSNGSILWSLVDSVQLMTLEQGFSVWKLRAIGRISFDNP